MGEGGGLGGGWGWWYASVPCPMRVRARERRTPAAARFDSSRRGPSVRLHPSHIVLARRSQRPKQPLPARAAHSQMVAALLDVRHKKLQRRVAPHEGGGCAGAAHCVQRKRGQSLVLEGGAHAHPTAHLPPGKESAAHRYAVAARDPRLWLTPTHSVFSALGSLGGLDSKPNGRTVPFQ